MRKKITALMVGLVSIVLPLILIRFQDYTKYATMEA